MMRYIAIEVQVPSSTLIEAVANLINHNPDFDARHYSLFQAALLESAARLIREGIERNKKKEEDK